MKYLTTTLAALALMVAPVAAADVSAESSSAGVNIGTLTCRAEPAIGYLIGSHRDMQCAFSRAGDKIEYYNGSISRLGVDLGVTNNQTLVWLRVTSATVPSLATTSAPPSRLPSASASASTP